MSSNDKKVQALLTERSGKGGEIININIGGSKFATLQCTLDKAKNTKLEKLLVSAKKDKDGYLFIDRSPKLFEYVLDALRSGTLLFPEEFEEACELFKEIEWYGLRDCLCDTLFGQKFPGTKLITSNQRIYQMNMWVKNTDKPWSLLYQASQDGFDSKTFHAKCTLKACCLVIIQSSNGYIFGGWTAGASFQTSGYSYHNECFMFSLVNRTGLPIYLPQTDRNRNSLYSTIGSGPIFGSGPDLSICNNCNLVTSSTAKVGGSYFLNQEYAPNSTQSKSFLAGSQMFTVKEIEVYQLQN
jgi:hypothetical protein